MRKRSIPQDMEKRFMKQFKGWESPWDEVDFETKSCLFEVKTAKLFTTTSSKRKRGSASHLGRFFIRTNNHIRLYLRSLEVDKAPKYLFIVRVGKQPIIRSVSWEEVNGYINNERDSWNVPISKVFAFLCLEEN